ncbi:Inactive tyrosine-protein kinase transmembrane receptor ROR1 [Holothuria leucospilota]|uniref:Inactive tyrosine-protein kinase transmembrane receptor ROR1 n=1 Tax=Holothuria leucospilota TaxID=206669 RepID=A0A9Q1CP14_HOLLE|nr:Inactive tyrosine-protein kinase transmembrane receptor ROR1 [Holothuria leucospilota]
MYDDWFAFTEGSSRKVWFGLEIKVHKKLTSQKIRGKNLWRLGAWISPYEDGSGKRFSEKRNILRGKDRSKEYFSVFYHPWDWPNLKYTMDFIGGGCKDYRFFCVQFGLTENPQPVYDLPITLQAVNNKTNRLIDCVPLGECKGLSLWVIVTILLLLIVVIAVFIIVWRRRTASLKQKSALTSPLLCEIMRDVDPILKSKEIHPSNVELHNELGRGKFGVVYKATVHNLEGTSEAFEAAVKTSNEMAEQEERKELVEEMKIMVHLGDHPNILPLLASCSVREPYYLITVCMEYGDLLHFLRKCRKKDNIEKDSTFKVGEKEKLMIALQIAKGMAYVREQRFYHGDLAARNILVGEGLDIKISDFGLSEDLYTKAYKRRAKEQAIPIKWCSLETILHGICSSDADICAESEGYLKFDLQPMAGPTRTLDSSDGLFNADISFGWEPIMADNEKINIPVPLTGDDAIPTDDHNEDNFAPIHEEDDNINIDDLQEFMMIEWSFNTDGDTIDTSGAKNVYVES